jgi:hypothetical protein
LLWSLPGVEILNDITGRAKILQKLTGAKNFRKASKELKGSGHRDYANRGFLAAFPQHHQSTIVASFKNYLLIYMI